MYVGSNFSTSWPTCYMSFFYIAILVCIKYCIILICTSQMPNDSKVFNKQHYYFTGKFALRVQNEVEQRLTEFCQENALVITNTLFQQHKRWLYTWTSPDGQHQNQTDYILCSWRWRNSIQSAKARPEADCGSDHEFFIAKFRLKLKKVGKTTNHSGIT